MIAFVCLDPATPEASHLLNFPIAQASEGSLLSSLLEEGFYLLQLTNTDGYATSTSRWIKGISMGRLSAFLNLSPSAPTPKQIGVRLSSQSTKEQVFSSPALNADPLI